MLKLIPNLLIMIKLLVITIITIYNNSNLLVNMTYILYSFTYKNIV